MLAGLSAALDPITDVASVAQLSTSMPVAAKDVEPGAMAPLRVNLRQRTSAVSPRHQADQRRCDDTACSIATSLPKMQLSYWVGSRGNIIQPPAPCPSFILMIHFHFLGGLQEGDAEYDLPFTMDYVIDLAVRATEADNYTFHPCIIDTGSANLGESGKSGPSTRYA